MDANERWLSLQAGEQPDRPPMSFWRHFFDRENKPETCAEAMIEFQRRFDWDLIKINPKASYHIEPWGVTVRPGNGPLDKPTKISWPVHRVDDLAKIEPLPTMHPEFADQLKMVALVRKAFPRPQPIVMTMFTPLSVLGDLVPNSEILVRLIKENPAEVTATLERLTETFSALAVEFLNAGADGLFFATTEWASSDLLSWAEYEKFGRPYDLAVLAAAEESTFTALHVCAANNYLEKFADYPAEVVNWDATDPTNRPLREGWEMLQKPIMGGLDRKSDLRDLTSEALADKTRRLVETHADLPLAIGPGCAVPVDVPLEKLAVVRQAVIEAGRK